jgi:tetratricopeptide (TPR) repeat protein
LLALSELYSEQRNLAAAQEVLARAEQIAPRDPAPAYQLGQLLEARGNATGAENAYKRALAVNPAHVPSRLALGALYAEQNNLTAASQQYRAALDAGADDPAALKQIGLVLLANRQYDQAADAFERALQAPSSSADAELYHGLAQANLARGRLDDAAAQEQRALDESGGTYAAALVGLGDIALRRNQPTEAVQRYTDAVKLDGRLTAGHIGLGRAAAAQGNWSVAEARFRDAIAIDPNSAAAHLWLGEALARTPSPAAAIPEYARAIELQPRYPEAFYGLAQAQAAAGQLDLAQQNLATALQLRASYPDALLLQGKIYEQQGRDVLAMEAYGKSIAADGSVAEPYYRRALLSMRKDQLDDAENDLEQAIKIQPNFPEAHYWLGRAYLAQSQFRQARDELASANEQRGGNYPDALFYQAMAEEQSGLRDEALASYQAALAQNSEADWAGEARTAIDRLRQP